MNAEENTTMIGYSKVAVLTLLAVALAASPAAAQDYPSRPITLIVPYAAGGGNDVMARVAAEKMSKTLGQQVVVENRGGAGGSIATRQIAKSPPDGYTLGLGGTGTLAINPTLYPNVGYDPRKDFAPVGLIATSALVVVVHPSLPVRTIPELIALAKKEPGKLTFASAGTGSGIHLAAEYFATLAGIKLTHVPLTEKTPPALAIRAAHQSSAPSRSRNPPLAIASARAPACKSCHSASRVIVKTKGSTVAKTMSARGTAATNRKDRHRNSLGYQTSNCSAGAA
jgi:tripartite-type tricarboxylate transporter receptor subunit TctC